MSAFSMLGHINLKRQGGQAFVELSLVLPILAFILLGTLDLGRVYFAYTGILGAAQHGVRTAINPSSTDADVRNAVLAEPGSTIGISAADISVSPSPTRSTGQTVTVTVTYRFEVLTPFVNRIWGGGPLTLTASAKGAVV